MKDNLGVACDKNQSSSEGGAIFGKNCQISGTRGAVIFRDNAASLGGGVISAQETVALCDNKAGMSFEGSKASFGGVIACGDFSFERGSSALGAIEIAHNLGEIFFLRTLCTTSDWGQIDYQGGGVFISRKYFSF